MKYAVYVEGKADMLFVADVLQKIYKLLNESYHKHGGDQMSFLTTLQVHTEMSLFVQESVEQVSPMKTIRCGLTNFRK